MADVCGMIPFWSKDVPDQFYRLWTSLFLHAGLIHLAVTVALQFYIMRDIEKLSGALRLSLIYMLSGVGGNLASSIFVPYRAEVGPSGSQFGLLACLIVEVLNGWDLIKKPLIALFRLIGIAIFLFLLGILPWVDNYAHIFGFIIGFLLSLALLPYLTVQTEYSQKVKKIQIYASLITVSAIFFILFLLLYVSPVYECSFCQYLNCIPFTKDLCEDHDIKITRPEIL